MAKLSKTMRWALEQLAAGKALVGLEDEDISFRADINIDSYTDRILPHHIFQAMRRRQYIQERGRYMVTPTLCNVRYIISDAGRAALAQK